MNILNDFKFGKNIIGVDEVGRGCLAGPVFAAAIKLDQNIFPKGINDLLEVKYLKNLLVNVNTALELLLLKKLKNLTFYNHLCLQ